MKDYLKMDLRQWKKHEEEKMYIINLAEVSRITIEVCKQYESNAFRWL